MYTQPASTIKPAVIVYLIDTSDSMNERCGESTKIAMVNAALRATFKDMVRRSMRDGQLQRRYKIAIIAYNHEVTDLMGGLRDLADILHEGIPDLTASGATNTVGGFEHVVQLLGQHLPELQQNPAPLICHLTDGLYSTADPTGAVKQLCAMHVEDGAVLLENIYFAEHILRQANPNWTQWKGVKRANELVDDYARFLFSLSSPLPETYRRTINDYGYQLQQGAAMFFPGAQSDLLRLAFVVSAATQLR